MFKIIFKSFTVMCFIFVTIDCTSDVKGEYSSDNLATQEDTMQILMPEKELNLPFASLFGPITIYKHKNLILANNTHVKSRELICMDLNTDKMLWKYPGQCTQFFIYNDLVLVSDIMIGTVALSLAEGRELWRLPGSYIAYPFPHLENRNLYINQNLVPVYGEKAGIANLDTGRLKSGAAHYEDIGVTSLFEFKDNGFTAVGLSFHKELVQKVNKKREKNLAILEIKDSNGIVSYYIWKLVERTFIVQRFDKSFIQQQEITWEMPVPVYAEETDRAFSGDPEPEKLVATVHIVQGNIILYERYINYRWSWNRGTNRITCIDFNNFITSAQSGKTAPIWGQRESKEPYWGYIFLENAVFKSDGVMHFQEEAAAFYYFDIDGFLKKSGSQEQISSWETELPEKVTGIAYMDDETYLLYAYQAVQKGESSYEYFLDIAVWHKASHTLTDRKRITLNQEEYYDNLLFLPQEKLIILRIEQKDAKIITARRLRFYRVP